MRKILLFIIIFLINTSLFSNTTKIDSLNLRLKTAESIEKIELLIELSLEYVEIDTVKSLEFSNQALELSNKLGKHKAQAIGNSGYIYYLIGNHETSLNLLLNALTQLDLEHDFNVRANILKNIGFVYTEFKKYNRSLEYFNKALNIYLKLEHKADISKIYYAIGDMYYLLNKYKKALEYFHKSLSLDEELGDKEGMAILYYNIGDNYELLAEYVKALESYLNCLKIYEELADQEGVADSYNVIGNIFQALGDFDIALEYYNKYLEIQKKIDDKYGISIAYNNIGTVYDDNKDYDKALEYYYKAFKIDEELNDKEGIAAVTNNLGVVYYKLKEYDKALEYYQQSLSLSKELNDIWAFANTSNNIAELYLDSAQYTKSFSYVDQGFEYAENIEVKDLILESFHIYSKLYSKTNNYQKAFEYFKRYTDLKDTLFTTSIRKVAEIQRIHETEKKEKEIELLQKDNMIYKLEIEKHKLERWLLYLGLIIILASVFIIYYFYNMKKKANQLLEKLVEKRTKELQIEIIERKFIEKSLRKSEEKYRTLVETIDEGVGNVDENENFTFVNKAAANIFGYSKEELIGKNLREFTSKEEFQKILSQTSLRKQRKSSNYELSIKRKDGAMRVIYVTTTPIIRDDKKYHGSFGIFHDITERKQAEEALRESEEKYRLVTDNITDIVSMCDKNAAFVYISPSCQTILGYDPESLIGLPVYTLVHPDDLSYIKTIIQEKTERLEDASAIFRMRHKDGHILWFETGGRLLLDSEGKLQGAVFNTRDITRRKEMESHLLRSERLAGVGELAAGIAHEIRNPLGNISAAAQFCLSKYKADKQLKQYLEIILRNSEDADKVIKELIDFANPREISIKLEDIGKVIDSVIKHLHAVSIAHKVQIIKKFSKKLKRILLDEKWLEMVFSNFIINALEAMPDGGNLTITAQSEPKDNEIVVTFSDTGIGITKENLVKIFDPFFTTKKDGIGLGLCLAHQIIEAHNGKIHIESEIGKGTKVVVRLPIPRQSSK
ncbi:MAG: tetratricopeptide repeat protein [Candidatus Cloacimonetes bacterium]|nr:tetratricopeptide repeat protein [Candidatus Cloacimonadota bacterium]